MKVVHIVIHMFTVCVLSLLFFTSVDLGGSGVSGLMRGLATLPKVDLGAFSGQRQGWKTPKRTLWQCTASVCVVGVHCWEISLGLDPGNVICLSVLSIYPRFFFCVFIVYCRVLFCCMLMRVDCFGLVVSTCPPFPLGRICYVVLVM